MRLGSRWLGGGAGQCSGFIDIFGRALNSFLDSITNLYLERPRNLSMLTPVFMVTARKYFKLFLFERFLFLNWQLIYFLFRHFNLALPCTMGFLTKTFDSFTKN